MTVDMLVTLLAIGLFAGTFGGLLGIGGSVIILPALAIMLGKTEPIENQHIYQGTAMLLTVFVTGPAAWWHLKQKMVIPKLLKYMIPTALAGIFLGVAASNLSIFQGSGAVYLRRALGVFLLYVVGYNLYRLGSRNRLPDPTDQDVRRLGWLKPMGLVGMPMGFGGGLLGISGGSFCVPLQQLFLKIPLRRAIANSAATIFCVEIFGATYKVASLPQGPDGIKYALQLAAILLPTCVIGGLAGAKLTYYLPRNVIRIVFSLLMIYAAFRLLGIEAVVKLIRG